MKQNTKVFSKVYRTILHHLESATSIIFVPSIITYDIHGSMKGPMCFIKEEKPFIFSLANYFKSKENYLMLLLCVETLNF